MLLGQGLGLEVGLRLELCPCQHPRWPIAPGAESVPWQCCGQYSHSSQGGQSHIDQCSQSILDPGWLNPPCPALVQNPRQQNPEVKLLTPNDCLK